MELCSKVGDPEVNGTIFERDATISGVSKHWAKSWDLEVRSKILEHKSGSVSLMVFLEILNIFVRVSKVLKLVLISLTPKGVNDLVFICQGLED